MSLEGFVLESLHGLLKMSLGGFIFESLGDLIIELGQLDVTMHFGCACGRLVVSEAENSMCCPPERAQFSGPP